MSAFIEGNLIFVIATYSNYSLTGTIKSTILFFVFDDGVSLNLKSKLSAHKIAYVDQYDHIPYSISLTTKSRRRVISGQKQSYWTVFRPVHIVCGRFSTPIGHCYTSYVSTGLGPCVDVQFNTSRAVLK